jgi:hypothetical protein
MARPGSPLSVEEINEPAADGSIEHGGGRLRIMGRETHGNEDVVLAVNDDHWRLHLVKSRGWLGQDDHRPCAFIDMRHSF